VFLGEVRGEAAASEEEGSRKRRDGAGAGLDLVTRSRRARARGTGRRRDDEANVRLVISIIEKATETVGSSSWNLIQEGNRGSCVPSTVRLHEGLQVRVEPTPSGGSVRPSRAPSASSRPRTIPLPVPMIEPSNKVIVRVCAAAGAGAGREADRRSRGAARAAGDPIKANPAGRRRSHLDRSYASARTTTQTGDFIDDTEVVLPAHSAARPRWEEVTRSAEDD